MSISTESHQMLEEAFNRLASESILAQTGGDEGLIPAYSLLSDMADATLADASLHEPIVELRKKLDGLLDTARPFDEESLNGLRRLVSWLGPALLAVQQNRPLPVWSHIAESKPAAVSMALPAEQDGPVIVECLLDLNLKENAELLAEFHAEAIDHLSQIESSLLILDDKPDDRDALNQIFRSFHTIKGVSGFLQLTPMHTLTHEVESLLDLARTGKLRLNPTIITAILESRDAVQTMVAQITVALEQGKLPSTVVPVGHLMRKVKALAANPEKTPEPASTPVPLAPAPEKSAPVAVPASAVAGAVVPAAPVHAAASTGEAKGAGSSSTVRVNTEKLDSLMNVVGELVIVQSQISESGRVLGDANTPLARNIAQLGRITKELQHSAMSLRLMPIKPTFQKMERLARDLSRDFGKKVNFSTIGDDTEVDRTVAEEISDPLVHMVRNSLDHGLELPEVRVAAGKPEIGELSLKAYHQGSHIIIELRDDGRGIDHVRILQKAVEKGMVAADAVISRDEILQLIFAPGFSTAAKVTAVSGRGVGMDVVRRNIEKLRGKVEIETEVGKGTVFRIKLPLTMAIIDGLVVRVAQDRFILPTTSVQVALRPAREALTIVQGRGEVLDHRGRIVPIHRLHRKFNIPGAIENPCEGIIVIVEYGDRLVALMVDEMVSKQEVVIKNLGGFLANLPGIAGGAILGDGHIALILDTSSLFAA